MKIKHTRARTEAKKLLGDTNHLLITLLVGVEGVRSGVVTKNPTFNVTWNPRDLESTSKRARRFARAAALSWSIDALDAYLGNLSIKSTYDLSGINAVINDQLTQRSVFRKLESISNAISLPLTIELALAHLAIQWRNNLVHYVAENELDVEFRKCIRTSLVATALEPNKFGNIDGNRLLLDFTNNGHPTFKAVAAFVQSINSLIETIDQIVLRSLSVSAYVDGLILSNGATPAGVARLTKLWAIPDLAQRAKSIVQLLSSLGVLMDDPHDPYFLTLCSLSVQDFRIRFKL
ncbi:MAG: hypothetical protein EOP09_05690 [Proteobacteria bacterium]|nr:MAG: hypothetical protein EOP09_05690 [Pseudomonadota bacterium]